MRLKLEIALLAMLVMAVGLGAKTKRERPRKSRPHVHQVQGNEDDKNLVDFTQQPFSDQDSHITALRRNGDGFCSWDILSARAFGTLAARPGPEKKLFNLRVEAELSSSADSLFLKSVSSTAEDFPRWSMESARDGAISAESVLLYPETDAIICTVDFVNHGRKAVKLRPRLILSGGGDNEDSAVKLGRDNILTLNFDRSKLVQRELVENACVRAGASKVGAIFSIASMQNAENLSDAEQVGTGGFTLAVTPEAFTVLKPGQVLRFPVVISVALQENDALLPMARLWTQWALPKGEALDKAEARWHLTQSHLPKMVDPKFERLGDAAALTLIMSRYAKRGALESDMFSEAKGYRDAFFSTGLPMAALGWSEIDYGTAEAALLELTSFSSTVAAPVPPYTGEDLLLWEASGLPLHGLASWELYQRDPNLTRANEFMKGMGTHLRNECAWWPPHRDGDGNGLYAFANQEEKPWYQLEEASGEADTAPIGVSPKAEPLPTYNIALTSLVGWQMQAAAAMAAEAGAKEESDKLMAESAHISGALKQDTRSPQGIYEQGLDGMFPYLLGLDQDLPMARSALGLLTQSAEVDPLPFVEHGLFYPWRAYWMLRTLSLYGDQDAAQTAAAKILGFLDGKPMFSAYHPDGSGVGAPGDVATASAVLETALERYQQDAYLLADTKALSGRFLQVRTPDGAFYLKRIGLNDSKAPYDMMHLASPSGAPILTEGAFVLSADKPVKLSLMSHWNLDISEAQTHREIFRGTKHAELLIKGKTDYLIKIIKP